jgi:hypothetical protein
MLLPNPVSARSRSNIIAIYPLHSEVRKSQGAHGNIAQLLVGKLHGIAAHAAGGLGLGNQAGTSPVDKP